MPITFLKTIASKYVSFLKTSPYKSKILTAMFMCSISDAFV